eukprot:TRINITY_DN2296_c0_g1_i1.p2 TRINITY_DN2296_c0_g1~~TRINITY_DN2296_c0_g1_i1.p2  ORF type:complete len:75 (+),score=18.97 TRINITY_DN2296_c0_g1_i1:100-324(+)
MHSAKRNFGKQLLACDKTIRKPKKIHRLAMDMGDSDEEGGDDEDFPELDIPSKAPPLGGSFPPPHHTRNLKWCL